MFFLPFCFVCANMHYSFTFVFCKLDACVNKNIMSVFRLLYSHCLHTGCSRILSSSLATKRVKYLKNPKNKRQSLYSLLLSTVICSTTLLFLSNLFPLYLTERERERGNVYDGLHCVAYWLNPAPRPPPTPFIAASPSLPPLPLWWNDWGYREITYRSDWGRRGEWEREIVIFPPQLQSLPACSPMYYQFEQ